MKRTSGATHKKNLGGWAFGCRKTPDTANLTYMIRWFENPIFAKTVQVENRKLGTGPQAWLRRYGVAWLIWLVPLGLISLFSLENLLRNPDEVRWVFQISLKISAFFMLLHCVSKSVHGTINGISLEKEQKTYESLQATLLTPAEIVGENC